MGRKLTLQEKRAKTLATKSDPPNKPESKKIEVQARYVRKLPEGSVFDFMKSMKEWRRHGYYKTIKDAEKAVEMLNNKDGLMIGASPKKRVYEYRMKPKY